MVTTPFPQAEKAPRGERSSCIQRFRYLTLVKSNFPTTSMGPRPSRGPVYPGHLITFTGSNIQRHSSPVQLSHRCGDGFRVSSSVSISVWHTPLILGQQLFVLQMWTGTVYPFLQHLGISPSSTCLLANLLYIVAAVGFSEFFGLA